MLSISLSMSETEQTLSCSSRGLFIQVLVFIIHLLEDLSCKFYVKVSFTD